MKRADSEHLHHIAHTDMESALDAFDWCKAHRSCGLFSFNWSWTADFRDGVSNVVLGEFRFDHKDDQIEFVLRWSH